MTLVRCLPEAAFPPGVPASPAWTVVLPRPVRVLPTPGYAATTLGPVVFLRRHDADPLLPAHEAVHVWQWRSLGPWRFARRYLSEYVRGLRRGLGHAGAYAAISLEAEARRLSGEEAVPASHLDLS